VQQGDIFIIRNVVSQKLISNIIEYLSSVGRHSFPNYVPILRGSPNSHRLNISDARAYVKGCFHQFSFYPWNQDVFNFFGIFKNIYYLKNAINGKPIDKFLGLEPEDGCIARLSFQFYPSGSGYMNMHSDPVDHHQLVVPNLMMSNMGSDFMSGGFCTIGKNNQKLMLDDNIRAGDVVLFNAVMPHGVELIDGGQECDWLSFRGRWILLFATNKLADNTNIRNAVDIESGLGGSN